MIQTNYGYSKKVDYDFDTAVQKTTESLKKEGFGVLTKIDIKSKMKETLDKDIEDYVVLGTCSPSYAYKALQVESEIGLFLPCKIIIYKKDGEIFTSAIRPTQTMNIVGNSELNPIAEEIEQKLVKVINQI
ncbi:DUF302 domain-containing protein [Candidatus Pacearchaeota archaeon]|nr:DUF302 domain-containing protein [Candidatus Pacearchaeota archaeon]